MKKKCSLFSYAKRINLAVQLNPLKLQMKRKRRGSVNRNSINNNVCTAQSGEYSSQLSWLHCYHQFYVWCICLDVKQSTLRNYRCWLFCWCYGCFMYNVHIYAVLFLFANTVVYTKLLYALFCCMQKQVFTLSRFFTYLHANFYTNHRCWMFVSKNFIQQKVKKWFGGSDCRIFQSQRVHSSSTFLFVLLNQFISLHCDSLILHR